jgi:CRP/FNR family cyclic AMP-dependent transcriptional regulator
LVRSSQIDPLASSSPARATSLSRKLSELTRRGAPRDTSGRTGSPMTVSDEDVAAKLNFLRETEVFATLTVAEQQWLSQNTTMITCKAGRVFYTPDDTGEVIYILKRGTVNLYRLAPDGRKLIVARLGAHTIFGEMSLIGQAMYGCFAEAGEECLLCVLSQSDLKTLIRGNPEVALSFLSELGKRLQQREEALEALAFRGVPARLATFLLREADAYGVVTGFSHEEIAQRIGTYRETVSQALGRFRTEGLVAVEPKRIRLLEPVRLREIA